MAMDSHSEAAALRRQVFFNWLALLVLIAIGVMA
jgi:hypothetical protein